MMKLSHRTDDLTECVNVKVRENQRYKDLLFRIITDTLGYRKLCAQWVLKMLTSTRKDQRLTMLF